MTNRALLDIYMYRGYMLFIVYLLYILEPHAKVFAIVTMVTVFSIEIREIPETRLLSISYRRLSRTHASPAVNRSESEDTPGVGGQARL